MGTLSNLRAQGRGPRPRSNGAKNGPLRKVVGRCWTGDRSLETLECGHQQMAVQDLMGETNAIRRRCRACKAGRPPDVEQPA